MNDDFIPVIGISSILIIVLGFIAIMRYITYKENLLFAEKGLIRPRAKKWKRSPALGHYNHRARHRLHTWTVPSLASPQEMNIRFTSDPGCWVASSRFFLASA